MVTWSDSSTPSNGPALGLVDEWRCVPRTDLSTRSMIHPATKLFDQLIGSREKRIRNGEAKSLGGL